MKVKCPNPHCKDGLIGVLDTGFGHPVHCAICEGKGEMEVPVSSTYKEVSKVIVPG